MKREPIQQLTSWQEATRKVQQLPRSLVWGARIVFLILFLVWVAGAVYLHSVVKQDEQELLKIQQRAQQREERLRREASYRQQAEQRQKPQSRVKNAIDGVKK